MKPHISSASALPFDVRGIMGWSPWGPAVVALVAVTGCLPADRGWVREELALVQVAEMRDRVVVVEQQFGLLDPKVARILAQVEKHPSRRTELAGHHPDRK